jgi:hypothetical protein
MAAQWTLHYLPEQRLLRITTSGTLTGACTEKLVREIQQTGIDLKTTGLLMDNRKAELQFGTMDIYDCPKIYQQLANGRQTHLAIVFKEIRKDTLFYETVCTNMGYQVAIFTDYDQAAAWLAAALRGPGQPPPKESDT